jgi:6-phosphogluconolactonase
MAASTEVKIFPTPKKVTKKVAREIKKLILESKQKRFNIALSGGQTPKKLFKTLVKKHSDSIPWNRVHFWWGDERCVSPDSDESNFRLANENLFLKIALPARNIHRIQGENNPEIEAKRYSEELMKHLEVSEKVPVFDLVLLGMGEDGHTASIFPGRLDLTHNENFCAVAEHPETGQKRITLTGAVINNAKNIFFLVTGESKAARLSEIMNNEEVARQHPAYYIEPRNGTLTWFIDEQAASEIS